MQSNLFNHHKSFFTKNATLYIYYIFGLQRGIWGNLYVERVETLWEVEEGKAGSGNWENQRLSEQLMDE